MAKAKTAFAACLMAAMALASLGAKDFYTVEEFSAVEIDSGESVKIVDTLDEETQRKLVGACNKLKGKIALDLSACNFGDDEARIDFFHIGNVRSCVLPARTKTVVNFDCDDLEEIKLPAGLEKIACHAFFESGLKSVDIPSSVQYVGACAFGDCNSLKFIKTGENPNIQNWSLAWSAWNGAKIIQNGAWEEKETEPADNPNKIEFDHKVYYLIGGKLNMKIRLGTPPEKSQKAKLYFYDAHNGSSAQGYIAAKLKKGKSEFEVK
ncbi:MAG: leucine-rich repeat protein, partial [Treponema sp.]|nr:leucine-rich repeat protein [Treponema sp.]